MADSHCHLDIMGGDVTLQLALARSVGIDTVVQVGVDFGTLATTVFWTTAAPVAGATGRVAVTVWLPFGPLQSNFLVLRSSSFLICPGGSWW